ncbi:MAG: Mu-like prophage major head subunit gpT family protein [Treponema sp.]|jgi:hypothetical protein|nr:Mu-like prophage major head subunit gpT family protein [Treponema sp.]
MNGIAKKINPRPCFPAALEKGSAGGAPPSAAPSNQGGRGMISASAILNDLRTALRDEFRRRMAEPDAEPVWKLLSTVIPSSAKSNTCRLP